MADTAAAVEQIEGMLDDLGGYISDANLYKSSYGEAELLRGTLTLRVPAERLDETLALLADLALDVRAQTMARQDVTDQYSDIEAQLRNLRATEEELLALLTEVRQRPNATPQDILTIHESLTQIRGQIEQLQGRQNLLDNQIALSTVTIELIPDAANRPLVDAGWRPAIVTRDALRALVNTLEFMGTAAIWVGLYLLPLALLAVIPLLVVVWLLRFLARQLQRRRLSRA